MPAASPFKSAIPWDADCLIFDRDVQILTATLPTPDVLPAHDRVGTALAFLETPAVPRRYDEANQPQQQERDSQWQKSIVSTAETLFQASNL